MSVMNGKLQPFDNSCVSASLLSKGQLRHGGNLQSLTSEATDSKGRARSAGTARKLETSKSKTRRANRAKGRCESQQKLTSLS